VEAADEDAIEAIIGGGGRLFRYTGIDTAELDQPCELRLGSQMRPWWAVSPPTWRGMCRRPMTLVAYPRYVRLTNGALVNAELVSKATLNPPRTRPT
jgi:hypothetical protein